MEQEQVFGNGKGYDRSRAAIYDPNSNKQGLEFSPLRSILAAGSNRQLVMAILISLKTFANATDLVESNPELIRLWLKHKEIATVKDLDKLEIFSARKNSNANLKSNAISDNLLKIVHAIGSETDEIADTAKNDPIETRFIFIYKHRNLVLDRLSEIDTLYEKLATKTPNKPKSRRLRK